MKGPEREAARQDQPRKLRAPFVREGPPSGRRRHMKRLMLLITAVAALALIALPSVALAKSHDRNHDRIPDKWERHFHLSLNQNQAKRDQDHDGLNNKQEFKDR